MYVPFEELPDHARIWIYQAARPLTAHEQQLVESTLTQFCHSWNAHQQPLRTSYVLAEGQFIILAADEDYNLPSGCSIDSSVRVLKDLQSTTGVDLFDRTKIGFCVDGKAVLYPLSKLKELFGGRVLDGSTITYDNLIPSKGDFLKRWKAPAEKTWLAKYLPDSTLA